MPASLRAMQRERFSLNNTLKHLLFCLCLLCLAGGVTAQAAEDAEAVVARLAKQLGVKPADVAAGPIPGLYRVRLGPQVAYVSADGRYLVRGDIVDIRSGNNLSAKARAQARLDYLKRFTPADMIVFAPRKVRRTITVLTDIDCGYCRLLEHDRPALNRLGIAVHYLFFPRDGVGSASWDKAEAVWCARDRKTAFTAAMRGETMPAGKCNTAPLAEGYRFAHLLGLDGTPAIITDEGQLIDGYLPLAALTDVLHVNTAQSATR
ncbi:MAG TPA: DsbC family protein [Gammaproteobacteria bacterium]|nr:DsbC family protein [Gammaproteobacteria bacterium]